MDIKKLVKSIAVPLIMGFIVGLIMMPFNDYSSLNQPAFAPPAIAFPIVWTILYILMGISAYIASENNGSLNIYYIQLVLNGLWSIIFFVFKLRLLAFIWIIVLIFFVTLMIKNFVKVSKLAGYLQIPYLIWLIYAAYLNFGVYILN
ncbi:MAG: tryptophan-rich sensory protein [Bacilli bacterium]|nr:tryptophan-rich sensory protein [Bacilli bacterium]